MWAGLVHLCGGRPDFAKAPKQTSLGKVYRKDEENLDGAQKHHDAVRKWEEILPLDSISAGPNSIHISDSGLFPHKQSTITHWPPFCQST